MPEELKTIRVIIVDDHPIVRTGLRWMLETVQDIELVGEAADGATAINLVSELQPHVVLMDLSMPGVDGLEAISQIRQKWPHIAVIILTNYNEDNLMLRGLQAGARGYLLKDADLDILLRAIQTAARGEMLVQPEIMTRILSHLPPAEAPLTRTPEPKPRHSHSHKSIELTEREHEVLARVAQGERSKEIAAALGLTERTVSSYLTTIYNKLGVDSRASAVAVAIERGILSL
jgi:two-component system, NarL family, response regulator YdfI